MVRALRAGRDAKHGTIRRFASQVLPRAKLVLQSYVPDSGVARLA